MRYLLLLFTGVMVMLTGCSSPDIQDYANKTPVMDIREYLNGDVEAWDVFIDMYGMADPSFHAKMKGTWQGNNGTFDEHFDFSDGRKEQRTWKITFTDDHHFTATAHDIIGEAVGRQYGNAVNLRYVIAVNRKGSTYHVSMDDWMYRMDEHTVLNRITMRKFGIKVGELIITFRKK